MRKLRKTTKIVQKKMGLPREARAKWGQNFLRDKGILKKIVDFARIEKEDVVVEVGPGEGTLTEFLLERAKKVIAIEKDEKLAEMLKEKFREQITDNRLQIIVGDILKIENLSKGVFEMPQSQKTPFRLKIENYILVGNIPYYITGALFKKFLESENPPASITFVIQKEVAERIIAKDGKESILSISIKIYGTPECGGVIKAGSFYPKPKVDSAIIAVRGITPLAPLILRGEEKRFEKITPPNSLLQQEGEPKQDKKIEAKFFEILKAGFAHKRKLLIKNLEKVSKGIKGHPLGQNSSRVSLGKVRVSRTFLDILKMKEVFKKCGISEKARAEDLKVEDWICLTKELV